MGGFLKALNFIGVIGKRMKDCGIEDLFAEADLYGSSITQKILNGKAYNRGMRAHKIMYEALTRIMFAEFGKYVEENKRDELNDELSSSLNDVTAAFQDKLIKDVVKDSTDALVKAVNKLNLDIEDYRQQMRMKSHTFAFWDEYRLMIDLLLQYISAERNSDYESHLRTFVHYGTLQFRI